MSEHTRMTKIWGTCGVLRRGVARNRRKRRMTTGERVRESGRERGRERERERKRREV